MWLADSVGQGLDASLPAWFQATGVIAVLVALTIGWLRGWLVPGSSYRQALADKDSRIAALEAELQEQKEISREQTLFLRDQVTPLLTRNTDVLAKVLEERRWNDRQRRET